MLSSTFWVHSGFSVFAGPPVEAGETATLELQARYISRPALAMDVLQKQNDGSFAVQTDPDPNPTSAVKSLSLFLSTRVMPSFHYI